MRFSSSSLFGSRVRDHGHMAGGALDFLDNRFGLTTGTHAASFAVFRRRSPSGFFLLASSLAVLLLAWRRAVCRLDQAPSGRSTRVLIHTLFYIPTLALTNSLSFRQSAIRT